MSKGIKLYIEGDYALFTRPEMKAERVSYDVITPSAARGILEAIYWKPQIRWVIDKIHVLKPIRFTNIRRNEVSEKAGKPSSEAMCGAEVAPLGIIIEETRQQRASLILKNVAYVIEAHFDLLDCTFERGGTPVPANECAGKHREIFTRRARKGQAFQQPYFGCREFPVRFKLLEDGDAFPPCELSESEKNKDLGFMLHDMIFTENEEGEILVPDHKKRVNPKTPFASKKVRAEARFFRAKLENGIISVPALSETLA
ncbi:MAG: type I-C CRISPR-associated protein Cas5 [Opitutales bacterium]|nr:type I-C CRISPR-associated protein Cas5 [Opitutales bacterium]